MFYDVTFALDQDLACRIPKWRDLRLQRCLTVGVSSGEAPSADTSRV